MERRKVFIVTAMILAGSLLFVGGQSDRAFGAKLESDTLYDKPNSVKGTYFDLMKTIYNRAGSPDFVQLPMAAYDKNYELNYLAAESFEVSEDGLTWTITLKKDLTWSDGKPVTAKDYVIGLERAVTEGYDFGWYWSWAAGIKNWGKVEKGEVPLDQFGVQQIDDYTIAVTTESPKPYFPGICTYWYSVPAHLYEQYGDTYATKVETMAFSGPFILKEWVKDNRFVYERNPAYKGKWQPTINKIVQKQTHVSPEVSFPAFLAGELDRTELNVGQLAWAKDRYADMVKASPLFLTFYLSFDYQQAPFDNPKLRQALSYAVNRDELTGTILKNVAVPARTLVPPGFPAYNDEIIEQVVFDPEKAKALMTEAGYPDGKGFPEVELWYRIEGGIYTAISKPMAEYLQSQFKEILGIDIGVRGLEVKAWIDGLNNLENNLWMAPYMYDYVDPSNFFSILLPGGRHNWNSEEYGALVEEANTIAEWEKRNELYIKAEQIILDEGAAPYLVHGVENSILSERLSGVAVEKNSLGVYFFPPLYFVTHVEIKQ